MSNILSSSLFVGVCSFVYYSVAPALCKIVIAVVCNFIASLHYHFRFWTRFLAAILLLVKLYLVKCMFFHRCKVNIFDPNNTSWALIIMHFKQSEYTKIFLLPAYCAVNNIALSCFIISIQILPTSCVNDNLISS